MFSHPPYPYIMLDIYNRTFMHDTAIHKTCTLAGDEYLLVIYYPKKIHVIDITYFLTHIYDLSIKIHMHWHKIHCSVQTLDTSQGKTSDIAVLKEILENLK